MLIKRGLQELNGDLIFNYNGKESGVTFEILNYIPTYQVWYGDKVKYYKDLNKLLNDKFYDGMSIKDFANDVEFEFI